MTKHNSIYRIAKKQQRQRPIPKEAPWKTLVLNEQFRGEAGLRI
jgi:hypothetical protein